MSNCLSRTGGNSTNRDAGYVLGFIRHTRDRRDDKYSTNPTKFTVRKCRSFVSARVGEIFTYANGVRTLLSIIIIAQ